MLFAFLVALHGRTMAAEKSNTVWPAAAAADANVKTKDGAPPQKELDQAKEDVKTMSNASICATILVAIAEKKTPRVKALFDAFLQKADPKNLHSIKYRNLMHAFRFQDIGEFEAITSRYWKSFELLTYSKAKSFFSSTELDSSNPMSDHPALDYKKQCIDVLMLAAAAKK